MKVESTLQPATLGRNESTMTLHEFCRDPAGVIRTKAKSASAQNCSGLHTCDVAGHMGSKRDGGRFDAPIPRPVRRPSHWSIHEHNDPQSSPLAIQIARLRAPKERPGGSWVQVAPWIA